MPNFKAPTEEAYKEYMEKMRDKLRTLLPAEYTGFFPTKSEGGSRFNDFNRFFSVMNSYIKYAPNGLPPEERESLLHKNTTLFLYNAATVHSKELDKALRRTLDMKYLLESTAPDGRTHFENLMDFAHASDFSVEALNNVVSAMNEDLDLDLAVKAFHVDRVPNTALQARKEEKKTALDWISEFKAEAETAAKLGDKKNPDTEWLINTLAARSLANSQRHKSARLKGKEFTAAQIADRANQLMADKGVRDYIDELKKNPQELTRAAELLQKGNGGRLEDHLTTFLVARNEVPYTTLGIRYRPTAKQMIELMQGTLKNQESSPEKKQEALAAIIAVRKTMGVKRATMGLMGDDTLKLQIKDYPGFQRSTETTLQALQKLTPQEQSSLMTEACSGHGGAMVQNYDKLIRQAEARPPMAGAERGQQQPQRQVVPGKG